MSDGPHRCLNMRKSWKDAAQAAASRAFSDAEVEERVVRAIRNDWTKEVPTSFMTSLRECFGVEDQATMFSPSIQSVSTLAGLVPGSAFAATLTVCAEDAAARNLTGRAALNDIITSALEDRAERSLRHIQEIYHRESSASHARIVTDRVSQPLNRAIHQLASELGSFGRPERVAVTIRATGIDEGPRL